MHTTEVCVYINHQSLKRGQKCTIKEMEMNNTFDQPEWKPLSKILGNPPQGWYTEKEGSTSIMININRETEKEPTKKELKKENKRLRKRLHREAQRELATRSILSDAEDQIKKLGHGSISSKRIDVILSKNDPNKIVNEKINKYKSVEQVRDEMEDDSPKWVMSFSSPSTCIFPDGYSQRYLPEVFFADYLVFFPELKEMIAERNKKFDEYQKEVELLQKEIQEVNENKETEAVKEYFEETDNDTLAESYINETLDTSLEDHGRHVCMSKKQSKKLNKAHKEFRKKVREMDDAILKQIQEWPSIFE